LCLRAGDGTIEMIGMCWIDFGGTKFPLRAVITLSNDHSELARYTAQIGEVDQATGAPPRLHRDSMILPSRDENGQNPEAELLVGHRTRPIIWQTAFEYDPTAAVE